MAALEARRAELERGDRPAPSSLGSRSASCSARVAGRRSLVDGARVFFPSK